MPEPRDHPFPELEGDAFDDRMPPHKPLPWHDQTRIYRAIHTQRGRLIQLCFIPNSGEYNRYLALADLRLTDARKDGTELILEFSAVTVIVAGRFLGLAADYIASGRCAALEAFDSQRRDPPTEPSNPFIDSIRFFAPKPHEPAGKKPKAKPAPAKQPEIA